MAQTLTRLGDAPEVQPLRSSGSRSYAIPALVGAAVALGFLVRAFHVFSAGFPLNDGGLFYAMTEDLRQNAYRLPEFTSYNQESIPFAYPPLGFYATGLIADSTPLSLADVFRYLPFLATCLTIPAFLLSRQITSRAAVVASVFAFALVPRSFIWMLMGGGITPAPGFCSRSWRGAGPAALRRASLGLPPPAAGLCTLTIWPPGGRLVSGSQHRPVLRSVRPKSNGGSGFGGAGDGDSAVHGALVGAGAFGAWLGPVPGFVR
jgi:hypothetical protein